LILALLNDDFSTVFASNGRMIFTVRIKKMKQEPVTVILRHFPSLSWRE
jgi:hypothetical protein